MLRRSDRTVSPNQLILQTLTELTKQYSKLESITVNLRERDRYLFGICKLSLEKGMKERATIYANEVAEVRKTLSVLFSTKLTMEKAIVRLETVKEVCPTLDELRGLYGDVKNVLKLLTDVMPTIGPEVDALNNLVTEILSTTQVGSVSPIEPIVVKDAATEAILKEAAGTVEEELMRKIPEPPMTAAAPSFHKISKPMISLTTNGAEVYKDTAEVGSLTNNQHSELAPKNSNSLSEELILDYIYRHKGEMDIAQCSGELGMPQNEVMNTLDLLITKGKIKIEQG